MSLLNPWNTFTETAASVASMVAVLLKLPSKSPLKPIFIIDALAGCFCFFFLFRKDTKCCNAMDQSVSPYLFTKDTRRCDAMDQSVFPFVVHIYLKDTNVMDQSVTP